MARLDRELPLIREKETTENYTNLICRKFYSEDAQVILADVAKEC